MRRYAKTLALIAVLVVLSALALGFRTIRIGGLERDSADTVLGLKLGLDLQGGKDLVYKAALTDPDTGESIPPTSDQMESLKKTIERRVNASGLGEPIIQILGEDRILIQLPGVRDPDRAKELIGETARLEFKHRTVDLESELPGLSGDAIVGIRVGDLDRELEALEPGLTVTSTLQTTTSATSTESETAPKATTTTAQGALDDETGIPALVFNFTDAGAVEFSELMDRLRDSLEPTPGTGRGYPSVLKMSFSSATATPALQIPYAPFFFGPEGQFFSLLDDPYIHRTGDSNRFIISLLGAADDVADARAKFIGGPNPRLIEVMGKVDEDVGLTGDHLARSYAGQHQSTGLPIVNIEFNSEGTRKFGELTTRIAGTSNLLAIFLDDEELISPGASRAITGGAAYIEGRDFTFERVRDIALLLESGRLPIPIELIQERDVDAILGADSLAKSAVAGLAGLGLVLLFMALYYRLPGIIAAVALIIYGALLLAIFKMIPVTLTLSGVAAAILSVGMAVDANILIFERMKEELRAGRTLLSSINIGFNRAWPAIRDGNVSTLITCAILFWFADTLGASIVKGFAITLAIGVGASMFTAITISRTFLRLMAATPLARRLTIFVPSGAADLPLTEPRAEPA